MSIIKLRADPFPEKLSRFFYGPTHIKFMWRPGGNYCHLLMAANINVTSVSYIQARRKGCTCSNCGLVLPRPSAA